MRAPRIALTTLGVVLAGTVLGALVFAVWLLVTPSGARWLLAEIDRADVAEVRVQEVRGRLLGPLELYGLRVVAPGLEITLDRARIEVSPAALLIGRLRFETLALGRLVVRVEHSGEPPTPARIPDLPLDLGLRRFTIAQLELHLPDGETAQHLDTIALDDFNWAGTHLHIGRLSARHPLTGSLEVAADVRLGAQSVRIERLQVLALSAPRARVEASGLIRLDAQDSRLALTWKDLRWPLLGEARLASPEGSAEIAGQLGDLRARLAGRLGEQATLHADARYADQRIEATLGWTHLQWPLAGAPRVLSETGTLVFSGLPENFRYVLDAQLAAEGKKGRAQAAGSGGFEQLVVETLKLAVAKSEVTGAARIDWTAAPLIDADLRVRNLDPGLFLADWPGRLNGTLRARTRIEPQTTGVRFELALRDSRLRGYPLELDAQGESRDRDLRLSRFALRSGTTRLDGHGQVTPPFDVQATLDSPDLVALWPGLHGSAQLRAQLQGSLDAPRLVARGAAQQLEFGTIAAGHLQLDADLALAGAWKLDLDARSLRGPVEVRRAQLRLDGNARDHRMRLGVDAAQAQIDLEARGNFDHRRRLWQGQLASGRVQPAGLAPWVLEEQTALRVEPAALDLQPACWRALASRICTQLSRQETRVRAAFRLEQLDFAYFASFLPRGWELRGGIDGTGLVELREGGLAEARADLVTDPIEIRRDGETLLEAARGSLLVEETADAATARLRLPLQGGEIRFDARLDALPGASSYTQRPLGAQLEVTLSNLDFLRLASAEIEAPAGRVDGRMNWSGTLAQARAEGELRLSEGRLRLARPGIEITGLSARVGTTPAGALSLEGSAVSGKGRIAITGEAVPTGENAGARLAIRGEDFQAANTTELRAWVSPRLDLRLHGRKLEVSGEIDVPRAQITPVSFDSGIGPSSDQVIVVGEQDPVARAGMQLLADVRLNLGQQVRFEGNGLKTELTGSVRAIEAPGRPGSGRGEVRLVGGRYKAYGQELEIDSGRLLFNGGPLTEPAVEIRARRKPREDIEVGVFVRGRLDKPEFQLFSTPAMPHEQQLSWLVFGRPIEEGGAGDERAMLANAALSLGLTGTDFLAQNLRGGLRLDAVSFGADPGEDAQRARFTVGKYLSPKLYLSYGIGLFQPGQAFKLLYDLGHGFKFSTVSGVHTGGDLLYSFERK